MDWIAERLYLADKGRGLGHHFIRGAWRLQQWVVVPPTLLIKLFSHPFLPRMVGRGRRIWSTKMFDEQLRRDGLL